MYYAMRIAWSLVLFAGSARALAESIPVVTVCEALNDRERLNDQPVVVVGLLVSTDEGGWLIDDCEHKLSSSGFVWQSSVSLTYVHAEGMVPPPKLPKNFRWDKRVLDEKLKNLRASNADGTGRWYAVFGRFETRIPLEPRGGFGHLASAPAQLIAREDGYRELHRSAATICEIVGDPPGFAGKTVRVRGRVRIAFEDFRLAVSGCEEGAMDAVWLEYGAGPKRPGAPAERGNSASFIDIDRAKQGERMLRGPVLSVRGHGDCFGCDRHTGQAMMTVAEA